MTKISRLLLNLMPGKKNGNLCLDSIEWNPDRVSTEVIQDLMSQFSKYIFAEDPSIKHLTVGTGGKTPLNLFPLALVRENMKQGEMYGDAKNQYCIASNIRGDVDALTQRVASYSEKFKKSVLYLAPYFTEFEALPNQLVTINENIEYELPEFLQKKRENLPSHLTVNDFKRIPFEEYQEMGDLEKAEVSTACKMFNTSTEEEFLKWLPTIPAEDCQFLAVVDYSLETRITYISHLPDKKRLEAIRQLSILGNYNLSPELLTKTLKLIPERVHLAAVKQSFALSSSFRLCTPEANPESELIKMILLIYPEEERFAAIKQTDIWGVSTLLRAAITPELLKTILELLPKEHKLEAFKLRGKDRQSFNDMGDTSLLHMAAKDHELLKAIHESFVSLSESEQLEVVKQKNSDGESVLHFATENPESLTMILGIYPEEERLEAVKQKIADGRSVLHRAAKDLELLKAILKPLPNRERLQVVQHMFSGISVLSSAKNDLTRFKTTLTKNQIFEAVTQGESIADFAIQSAECRQLVESGIFKKILEDHNDTDQQTANKEAQRIIESVFESPPHQDAHRPGPK